MAATGLDPDNRIKKVILKNDAYYKDIGVVMPTYNLIAHSDNYSKTCGSLW